MSAAEEARLRHLLRSVTGAWNKCEARYEESQRALYESQEALKTTQARADGLEWQVSELREFAADMRDVLKRDGCYDYAWVRDRLREIGYEVDG